MVKDKGAVGEQPVKDEERAAVAVPRIAFAPIVGRKRLINRVNRVLSRNAQNVVELCEESEPPSVKEMDTARAPGFQLPFLVTE